MPPHFAVKLALNILAAWCFAAKVLAADVGKDDSGGDAYSKGWVDGSNGTTSGHAFQPWHFAKYPADSQDAKFFLEDSKSLSNPGADVNAGGKAFGLSGKAVNGTNCEADAYRDFSGGGLSVGQSFSIDLAVNYRNGFKGIDVRSGSDEQQNRGKIFTLNIGQDDYVVSNAATGNGSIGNEYNDNTRFHIVLTQTTATGGTWTITRGDKVTTGTFTGVATSIKLYASGTDGNPPDRLFFNNLSISV